MSKKKRRSSMPAKRDVQNVGLLFLEDWANLGLEGYVPLSKTPEIMAGVNKIASLIGAMTIHLMQNGKSGDTRINNALSRLLDIHPNDYMTRSTFIQYIVRTLLLEGAGNSVIYVETRNGLIEGLHPIPAYRVGYMPDGWSYKILVDGIPRNNGLIHIVMNPDPIRPWKGTGIQTTIKDVAQNLNQATKTKSGFMKSEFKPNIIVKVDAMVEEFSGPEGRKKLLDKYVESASAGQPWILPGGDTFQVESVRPLSLNDLAINEAVELDKRTVASILDCPAFVLGVGSFNKEEWNNWINTRVKSICDAIAQAFTRSLLIKSDWYYKFNYRSLLSYDIQTLSTVGANMYTRGIMTGNEVRDSLGYSPMDGLDELVILENYIPQGMIGDQKKLEGKPDE